MPKPNELEQFAEEFFQDIVNEAETGGWKEDIFFDKFTEYLVDAGEMNEAIRASYQPANGTLRVDGYCGDPLDSRATADPDEPLTLGLIILDFHQGPDLQTLGARDMNTILNRLMRYLDSALKPQWRKSLEVSDPGFGLADLIHTRWNRITKIRLYLLTNKVLSSRIDGKTAGSYQTRSISYSVWDINRLFALSRAINGQEPLRVDFAEKPLHPLRALLASASNTKNPVYLAAVPGNDLAHIYDRWGARLLEQNVRVFLQARSNVNKGIKRTLESEPELFFSFNNGITATAEHIETKMTGDGLNILSLDNLQIVNGGQTTASIYAAYRAGKDLSKVFVQMKLSIVNPEQAEDLVPRISEYANSQNKVSQADLFANHPFHTRIESFSRRILAPAQEGSFTQTKWFYERARGQYGDAQAYMSRADKTKFLSEYPKSQKFAKTDLAKYAMVWTDKAYYVNRGAQKNFAEFAKDIAEQWTEDNTQFNEYYYKTLIAQKIIWDTTEKTIPQMEWYEAGGYRSQHVVLAIGLIAEAVRQVNRKVDYERIWDAQTLDEPFKQAIREAADAVHPILMHPAPGYRNISEWAKQPRCWEAVKQLHVEWNKAWLDELISPREEWRRNRHSSKEQRETNGIEYTSSVVKMGAPFWKDVAQWLIDENEGDVKERGCVNVAASMPSKIPSDKQSAVIVQLMKRLAKVGCPYRIKNID
ncbi:AIPR family protein [Bifidobacterium miconisargentati]|uniref:AIPR family protein n=1 Tax=Bifidobacterium miconisargentati TaxID=2834437 RepID=UPI001BDD5C2E|nr:AIPR family protein [Bifidobacterium miconisargentati]MBW3090060.1 AIPR family protein [Bifidobacterium miconisargentati]